MVFRILRPDSVSVWNDEEILRRFSKYRGIIDGTHIARYLIAKTIECRYNSNDSIKVLENLLKEKSLEFNALLEKDKRPDFKDILNKVIGEIKPNIQVITIVKDIIKEVENNRYG